MEKIRFSTDDGEMAELFVLEQTRLNGSDYLLVTESDSEDEAECYIFKDISGAEETDGIYEPVEDEEELEALSKIFQELMEDVEFESR